MIRSNFQPLFKITVSHSYFEQGICQCLWFKEGKATADLSKRFGLKRRDTINGLEFYADTQATIRAFLNYISSTTKATYFDFDLETTDDAFRTFTESPLGWLGQFVYDSQNESNTNDRGITQLNAELSPDFNAKSVGSLKIYFSDIIKQGFAQFAISYMARATQWQYFIINRSAVKLDNPAISGKNEVKFDGPETVTMDNGQKAILFTSGSNLLPLSKVSGLRFDLVNNSVQADSQKSSSKIIFKGLPSPDPIRIGTVQGQSNQLASPMYVYI